MPNAPAHKMAIAASVRSADGRVLLQTREERESSELQGGRGGYGFSAQFPMKDLAPGLYVVRVEAKPSTSADTVVSRDVQFRVR